MEEGLRGAHSGGSDRLLRQLPGCRERSGERELCHSQCCTNQLHAPRITEPWANPALPGGSAPQTLAMCSDYPGFLGREISQGWAFLQGLLARPDTPRKQPLPHCGNASSPNEAQKHRDHRTGWK